MTTRTVLVDGLPIETTESGAVAIGKLIGDVAASKQTLADAKAAWEADRAKLIEDHNKALAAKDGVIAEKDKTLAAKDAEIDAAKAKIISDADIDKRVAARADLLSIAGTIAKDAKFDGLSDADVRKTVVIAVIGEDSVKDKPQAYIDARFDILVEDAKKGGGSSNVNHDTFRTVRQNTQVVGDAEKVRLENEARQRNAWKGVAA